MVVAKLPGGVKTPPYRTNLKRLPLRGAPPVGGEGWPQDRNTPPSHPSVTYGDSSPQGEPFSTSIRFGPGGVRSTTSLGFLGASAASLLRKPARAVIRPAGANIARSPVSLRSTVAPCSQPRNPLGRGPLPRNSGTFFVSFFGRKKGKTPGRIPLKKGVTARW